MDYSNLSDFEINKLVAELSSIDCCARISFSGDRIGGCAEKWLSRNEGRDKFDPCNNPADAWPIIAENNISLILDNPSSAMATSNCVGWYSDEETPIHASNHNALRAAMIVFLMMQESANVQGNPA